MTLFKLLDGHVDDDGVPYKLKVTQGEFYSHGYLDEDGVMHEYVRRSDTDEIVKERHTPIAEWNRI